MYRGVRGRISSFGDPFRKRGGSFRPGQGLEVTGYAGGHRGVRGGVPGGLPRPKYICPFLRYTGGPWGGPWGVPGGVPGGSLGGYRDPGISALFWGTQGVPGVPGGYGAVRSARKRQIYKLARARSTVSPPPLVRFTCGRSRFDRDRGHTTIAEQGVRGAPPGVPGGLSRPQVHIFRG